MACVDDLFASSSQETIYAAPDNAEASLMLEALKLPPEAEPSQPRFCHFCPESFNDADQLEAHLRGQHATQLSRLQRLDVLRMRCCPLCPARFFEQELLPPHLLQEHSAELGRLFRGRTAPDQKLACPFCDYKVLAAFGDLLSHHVDEVHISELQQYLVQQPAASSDDDHGDEPIHTFIEDTPVKTSCFGPSRKKTPFTCSTPIAPSRQTHGDFRCGSCDVFFESDCDLVAHVKRKHNKVKALMRPLYGCGVCSAVFYRNSFVQRHHRLHHTQLD
ncbi:zinc finger protein tra-4-like [Neocloeon triangulifer]|uniref:zinc finger protein tra-4-like n=1 Tax=Neocloeon triangulifer TaxID=2078957 RepID=UPI00286ED9B5|nr:zinc finger protein tra-4-like [Neocloeon triangulifer]XP_059479332.1 zinc finger protein tra-4-like [Neocloeon triangulifer]